MGTKHAMQMREVSQKVNNNLREGTKTRKLKNI